MRFLHIYVINHGEPWWSRGPKWLLIPHVARNVPAHDYLHMSWQLASRYHSSRWVPASLWCRWASWRSLPQRTNSQPARWGSESFSPGGTPRIQTTWVTQQSFFKFLTLEILEVVICFIKFIIVTAWQCEQNSYAVLVSYNTQSSVPFDIILTIDWLNLSRAW